MSNHLTSGNKRREKLSSAFTLSDMEIFIFPELFYPLVLANIMSPIIWKWKEDPWFNNIESRNFISRMNRIKQFIIDNFVFNLDLETWGLTTREKEIERFSPFFDTDLLKKSNALFGYEGDSYYFDIDIRKHFGLDRYNSNIIPYWKTETVEAMESFRYKSGFTTGAGECVSLSALYAAAIFVIGKIPLEEIFLMATPLHSQNFINVNEGMLTNNRRIVTKNMWYNGTSLSAKARRAIENEKITIVSHISGYIHTIYGKATIDRKAYDEFSVSLTDYLQTGLTADIFLNFLRWHHEYRSLFQFIDTSTGRERYITLEKIFEYEHSSRFNLTTETRKKLTGEIDGDEFSLSPFESRFYLNKLEIILQGNSATDRESLQAIFTLLAGDNTGLIPGKLIDDLLGFIKTTPDLPGSDKNFITQSPLGINTNMGREDIIDLMISESINDERALLALYVYREMSIIDWEPFITAAIERNNASFNQLDNLDLESLYATINFLDNSSIYDSRRLAQPDEVWNAGRGDGIEKALLMATLIIHNNPDATISITIDGELVELIMSGISYKFFSTKGFNKRISISRGDYLVS